MFADLGHFNIRAVQVTRSIYVTSSSFIVTVTFNIALKSNNHSLRSQKSKQKRLTVVSVFPLQLSFNGILFPSVALCYMGQAAYLRKFPNDVLNTFYKSIPGTNKLRLPVLLHVIDVLCKHSASKINSPCLLLQHQCFGQPSSLPSLLPS
jgi:K+ transporter